MKNFNKTYLIKTSKKQTIRMIDFIYKSLLEKLNNYFQLITVSAPMFDKLNASSMIEFNETTRPISFDLIEDYQIITFYQSLSRWAQKTIKEYGVLVNEGIIYTENSIWRDVVSNSKISQHKQYLCIELNISKSKDKAVFLTEITNVIYKYIYDIAEELKREYNIDNIYPKIVEFVESQLLDNEFHNLSSYDKEAEIAEELKAFILMEPGKKLLSGGIHSTRLNNVYYENLYNEIHLLHEIEGCSINIASIAYKLWGKELSIALDMNYMKDLKEDKLLDEFIKDESTQTMEIKINLFKLYLVLLKKGHIAEVQPNVISKDVNNYKKRHMIEPL